MTQLEHIEAIEKRLWGAADTLRANSNYASNEYFLPVMGLVFLRHAYSRYLAVKDGIEDNLPTRGGKTRALLKEDFSRQSAIFLQPKAQFDHLVALLHKLASRLIETCENECGARASDAWVGRDTTRARKDADDARQLAVEHLKQVRYFWRQAHPSASRRRSFAMLRGWLSWWTVPRLRQTTGA